MTLGRVVLVLVTLGALPSPAAAELAAGARVDALTTSNAYLDVSQEWDLVLRPSLDLGVDFGGFWSAGYGGELNYFTQHGDLLSHWHEAYLFANPAWGDDGQHELTVEVRGQWLANQTAFSSVDVVIPSLLGKLALEPLPWLRWRTEVDAGYRLHYRDDASSSLDVRGETSLTFTLPSRTTITPRVSGGVRWFKTPVATAQGPDSADYLLLLGLDLSQGLWKGAGLQLGAALLPHVSNNALVESRVLQAQFNYLGEDFLFSGHRARVGLKQVLGGLTAQLSFLYEQRDFDGWPAMDELGALTGAERRDTRFTPRVELRWVSTVGSPALQELAIEAAYGYTRQVSNHSLYDTDVHLAALALQGAW